MKKLVLTLFSLTLLGYGLIEIRGQKDHVSKSSQGERLRIPQKNHQNKNKTKKSISSNQALIDQKIQKLKINLKELTPNYLVNCLNEIGLCKEVNEFKKSINGEYYNASLTPIHHEYQERLINDPQSINTNDLFKSLSINNSGIYLLALEELISRDLNFNEKETLFKIINNQSGDILASSLIIAYKHNFYEKKEIFKSYIQGLSKNFISAQSLVNKAIHLRLDLNEFQLAVNESCKYQNLVDKELFRTLLNTQKRQARGLGLAGVYFCNSF